MKISSARFKDGVAKVVKGAGFNKLIPLTSMVGLKLKDGNLTILATDMTNSVAVVLDKVSGDDFDITIDADKFSKLVSKITSEEITLEITDNVLVIKAGGTYKLPLIADEDGLVVFPNIELVDMPNEVMLTSILQAYNINKPALAKTMERPELTGYYCGERVISTDGCVITFSNFNLLNSPSPMLISSRMVDLLTLCKDEKIKWGYNSKREELVFGTSDYFVVGPMLPGIEDYPADAICAYLDEAFPSSCKLPKELMLNVLDRLSLFIDAYDKNGAYFTFTRTGLNIHSKKDASTEVVNYVESNDFEPFNCLVDIPMLKEQIASNPNDTIKLYYGNENALKLEAGNTIQVISLLEDEE